MAVAKFVVPIPLEVDVLHDEVWKIKQVASNHVFNGVKVIVTNEVLLRCLPCVKAVPYLHELLETYLEVGLTHFRKLYHLGKT